MHLELWLAFVAASAVLLILPGPTILTVISYSISHGRRANLPLVSGVALGDSTALLVSLVGLGALLATSAFWFTAVKWVGGLYLLYLGIKLLRAQPSVSSVSNPEAPHSLWKLFANTYLVTALNPKGIVFFVAFLPSFLTPQHQSPFNSGFWAQLSWCWRRSMPVFTPCSQVPHAACWHRRARKGGSTGSVAHS